MSDHGPKNVVLWGIGDVAQRLVPYLREADITVLVCVDEQHHGTEFNAILVLSPDEYERRRDQYTSIPIVISGLETA